MSLEPGYQYVTVKEQKINMKKYQDSIGLFSYAILTILGKTKEDFEAQNDILKDQKIILGTQDNFHSVVSNAMRHAQSGVCLGVNAWGSNVPLEEYNIDLNDPRNRDG